MSKLRRAALLLCLAGCGGRSLGVSEAPYDAPPLQALVRAACCTVDGDTMTCDDARCPELAHAEECTTLAADHSCQVPLTDDCQTVVLANIGFQTVYCF